jgi:hypothetical protein
MIVAGNAEADTLCVAAPSCAGTSEPTIQAAFTAAAGAPAPSTVTIGPGDYGGSPGFNSPKQITVQGAGEGKTIITTSGPGSGMAVGGNADDLTVPDSGPNPYTVGVDVEGRPAIIQDSTFTAPEGIGAADTRGQCSATRSASRASTWSS